MSSGANQHVLGLLGVSALRSVEHLDHYWTLQRRHGDDERRWLDLAQNEAHADADAALERLVEHGHAVRRDLRVEHIRRRPD